MSASLIGAGDGVRRRFELAASPQDTKLLVERAIALAGGTVLRERRGGFDFAPFGPRRAVRASLDLVGKPGATLCELRMGWPLAALLRFAALVIVAAAIALALAARLGPTSFAGVAIGFALFGFGRYLHMLVKCRIALGHLALVTRALADSTLYRAPTPRSPAVETRRLITELCSGRIMPSDFTRARRDLLVDTL